MRRAVGVCLFSILTCANLRADDFWLAAAPWRTADGRVTITANVGQIFPMPENYTSPDRVERMRVIGPTGEVAVEPAFRQEQKSLATDLQFPQPAGSYLVVMTITPRIAPMKPSEFVDYLNVEGLDRIVGDFQKSAAIGDPRERYGRYAKAIVRRGDGGSAHVTLPVGLKAELVPAADPSSLRDPRYVAPVGVVPHPARRQMYLRNVEERWPLRSRTDAKEESDSCSTTLAAGCSAQSIWRKRRMPTPTGNRIGRR